MVGGVGSEDRIATNKRGADGAPLGVSRWKASGDAVLFPPATLPEGVHATHPREPGGEERHRDRLRDHRRRILLDAEDEIIEVRQVQEVADYPEDVQAITGSFEAMLEEQARQRGQQ